MQRSQTTNIQYSRVHGKDIPEYLGRLFPTSGNTVPNRLGITSQEDTLIQKRDCPHRNNPFSYFKRPPRVEVKALLQLSITVLCTGTEFLLNTNELVVLGHTVCTRHRTRLDLAGVCSNCDVSNGCILCFA